MGSKCIPEKLAVNALTLSNQLFTLCFSRVFPHLDLNSQCRTHRQCRAFKLGKNLNARLCCDSVRRNLNQILIRIPEVKGLYWTYRPCPRNNAF